MSLRIEQNWKWSNKTFPRTLCVVSTSDETTHCGICLTSNKNPHWESGGRRGGGLGGSLNQKSHFVGQFSPWKLEFCWVSISESRLTVKNLFTWSIAKHDRSIKMLSIFLLILPHPQCVSTKFPLPLTTCQITEAAYDGQKHSFPYRAWKWYSVRYSYYLSSG